MTLGRVDLGRSEGSETICRRCLQRFFKIRGRLGRRLGVELAGDLLKDLQYRRRRQRVLGLSSTRTKCSLERTSREEDQRRCRECDDASALP